MSASPSWRLHDAFFQRAATRPRWSSWTASIAVSAQAGSPVECRVRSQFCQWLDRLQRSRRGCGVVGITSRPESPRPWRGGLGGLASMAHVRRRRQRESRFWARCWLAWRSATTRTAVAASLGAPRPLVARLCCRGPARGGTARGGSRARVGSPGLDGVAVAMQLGGVSRAAPACRSLDDLAGVSDIAALLRAVVRPLQRAASGAALPGGVAPSRAACSSPGRRARANVAVARGGCGGSRERGRAASADIRSPLVGDGAGAGAAVPACARARPARSSSTT